MRALRLPSPFPPASFPSPSVPPAFQPLGASGLPCSQMSLLCICRALRPRQDFSGRPGWFYGGFPFSTLSVAERVHIPFLTCFHRFDAVPAITTTKTPAMPISPLNHTAFALAVYASCRGFPTTSKTRFRLVPNLYRVGLITYRNILKGFIIMAPVTPPFLGLAWRDGIRVNQFRHLHI
jgi:hypothetical protein